MCEPTTLAVIGLAVAGTSAYLASDASKKQANYQAQVAENNARTANQAAADAIQRGNVAAANQRCRNAQVLGAQRVRVAASGIDLTEGSAASILTDADYFGSIDEQTVRDNAAREAWGLRVQGTNQSAAAALYANTADNANPLLTSILAGGTVASRWYRGGGSSTVTETGWAGWGGGGTDALGRTTDSWYG